jgi:hypothetical protein
MKVQKLIFTQARGTTITSNNKQPKTQEYGYSVLKMTTLKRYCLLRNWTTTKYAGDPVGLLSKLIHNELSQSIVYSVMNVTHYHKILDQKAQAQPTWPTFWKRRLQTYQTCIKDDWAYLFSPKDENSKIQIHTSESDCFLQGTTSNQKQRNMAIVYSKWLVNLH